MADQKQDNTILTPVGRLVGGSPFEPQTKDMKGDLLVTKSGANKGQPRVDYYMALAIPKTDPGCAAIIETITRVAREGFPNLHDASGACVLPTFAFKLEDGDSQVPNSRGSKPCDREGYPGNWILKFGGGFAPKCVAAGGEPVLTDPQSIKRGYFVRIYGSVASNNNTEKPGVYLNSSAVELVGYGQEITSGPDVKAVFGAAPAALPAGASATPVAPATTAAVPGVTPAAAPQAVSPAPDFAQGPAAAGPAAAPAQPAQPAEVKYQAPDGVFTFAALTAAGYSPEQIAALPTVA